MKSIAYVLQGLLYVLFGALVVVYGADIVHEIVVRRRFLLLLVLFFLYPLLMTVLAGATRAACGLVGAAGSAASSRALAPLLPTSLLGVPLGLGGGFLLWQAVSWVLFRLLDIEPWLFKPVFGSVDLTV